MSFSYSNPATSTVLCTLNIIIHEQLRVAGEDPTIKRSYLLRHIVLEKRPSFRGHGDDLIVLKVVVCILSWRLRNNFPSPIILSDIDDIQDPRLIIYKYVGLYGPGWVYVLGMLPHGHLRLRTPKGRATDLDQGPHLRRGVRAGSLRALEPRARKRPAVGRGKNADMHKSHIYTQQYKVPLRDDAKSRG